MPTNRPKVDIPNFNEIQLLQAHKLFLEAQLRRTDAEITALEMVSPFYQWCRNSTHQDDDQC